MSTGQRIDVVVTLFIRLFLAGVFGFAAFMKLRNEAAAQAFAESIQSFDVLDKANHHHVLTLSTFAVPWAEAICAVFILVGFWTRAAAFVMLSALGVFMWAIYTVIARDLNVECGCFGDFNFPCDDRVGMCQMYRNGALAVACLFLIIRGGGRLSIDRFFGPPQQTRGSRTARMLALTTASSPGASPPRPRPAARPPTTRPSRWTPCGRPRYHLRPRASRPISHQSPAGTDSNTPFTRRVRAVSPDAQSPRRRPA